MNWHGALVCANANGSGPPKRSAPGLDIAGAAKLRLSGEYHGLGQWQRWQREGVRLFREYWRTGDLKHFQALGRHIHAMRGHAGRRRL